MSAAGLAPTATPMARAPQVVVWPGAKVESTRQTRRWDAVPERSTRTRRSAPGTPENQTASPRLQPVRARAGGGGMGTVYEAQPREPDRAGHRLRAAQRSGEDPEGVLRMS